MKNVVMLLGLVFTLNLNAQMETTAFSTYIQKQVRDGVRFQLDVTVMEGGDGDILRIFTVSDGKDYIYSSTIEANHALHQKQLVKLVEWKMNQFLLQTENDGSNNFIWYDRKKDYVTIDFEEKRENGERLLVIKAINMHTVEEQQFLYKIVGFRDNLKSEGNKLKGGSKI